MWAFENSDSGNLIVSDADVGLATTANTQFYKCDDPGATSHQTYSFWFGFLFFLYSFIDFFPDSSHEEGGQPKKVEMASVHRKDVKRFGHY